MDLLHLEQQRQALEQNLTQLRQTLKHWQTWEAEYEGLKEELQSIAPADLTTEAVTKIATTYAGELVNEKEVWELAGLDKGPSSLRSASQILGLIERRQDYVQKNIETAQKQFFHAEAKAEELTFAVATQQEESGAGLPLTEIHEELDDDGNVISSTLSRPEEVTATVVESLRQAGLSDEDLKEAPGSPTKSRSGELKPAITNASPPITPFAVSHERRESSDSAAPATNGDGKHDDLERPSIRKKSVSFTADTKAASERARQESEDGRKSVSFAEKVAVMPAAPPADTRSVSFSAKVEEIPPPSVESGLPHVQANEEEAIQRDLRESFRPGEKVTRLNEDGEIEGVHVVIPEDESPEDAQTRREMLEYHLNEVGNVVAQIDLEEEEDAYVGAGDDEEDDDDQSSFHTSSEYLDDEDTPYTTGLSESEDEEDEYGRSIKHTMSDEYRQQMKSLQQRLIGNLGPDPNDEDIENVSLDLQPEDARRLVIRDKRNSASSASSDASEKKSHGKKRVSFAEELDVADEPSSPPLKAQKHQEGENVAPVAETIIDRSTAASHSLPSRTSPEMISRSSRTRATPLPYDGDAPPSKSGEIPDQEDDSFHATQTLPTPPSGITLAETLKERTPVYTHPSAPPSADDPDPVTLRRELAADYYRRRNEIIKSQGGFRSDRDEDDMLGELMEEREDGKVKKVSKFMAARMKST